MESVVSNRGIIPTDFTPILSLFCDFFVNDAKKLAIYPTSYYNTCKQHIRPLQERRLFCRAEGVTLSGTKDCEGAIHFGDTHSGEGRRGKCVTHQSLRQKDEGTSRYGYPHSGGLSFYEQTVRVRCLLFLLCNKEYIA